MLNAIKSFILAIAVITVWSSPATIVDDAAQIIANELSSSPKAAHEPAVTVLLFDEATSGSSGAALSVELRCLAERIAASGAKAIAFDYVFPADNAAIKPSAKSSAEQKCFGVPISEWSPLDRTNTTRDSGLRRIGEQKISTIVAVKTASHLHSVVERVTVAPPDPTHVRSEPSTGALTGTVYARIDSDAGRTRSLFLTTPLSKGEGGAWLPNLALAAWLAGHATTPPSNTEIRACLSGSGDVSPVLSCASLAELLERLGRTPQIRFYDPKDIIDIRLASSVSATVSPNCGATWDDFAETCSHWFRDRIVIVGPARLSDLDQHTTPLSPPLSLGMFVKPFSAGPVGAGDMPGAVILGLAVKALDDGGTGFIEVSAWGAGLLSAASFVVSLFLFGLTPRKAEGNSRSLREIAVFMVVIVFATGFQASVFAVYGPLSVLPAWAIVACAAGWVIDWFLRRTDDDCRPGTDQ